MVLICNSTVQHLGHDQAEVVIDLALLFEDKRALASASAQAKRGSHQAGCRHSCLVPPTLCHS